MSKDKGSRDLATALVIGGCCVAAFMMGGPIGLIIVGLFLMLGQ